MSDKPRRDGVTLAIEPAVAGGSIGLYEYGSEVGSICGDESISRAEALLPNVQKLLAENSLGKSDIKQVVVSTGPGSFTGIRIGLATALGLKASLGVDTIGVSVLSAMSLLVSDANRWICAVPIGKADIGYQVFERPSGSDRINGLEPVAAYKAQLSEIISNGDVHCAVLHPALVEIMSEIRGPQTNEIRIVDAGTNLSRLLASREAIDRWGGGLEPIYLFNPAKQRPYPE
ncbi:MAG TPA: tRNA (adenosine(37)-N6)-threonylcarbamoyltransferase complex dimerization subunit type 1 TsaB [Pyrinomonadaceae bacterium]|nr:tRNA (adenosine(37)-N6)-threonylcarbamoyltransferase complex dimerization subunit type 1 TsaB [Pyrinomonadaceae bacterium]HMP64916.1 tRNA (adenosine(37)-N6)-threonylcarbamoyltransferase complex dimerization subunit type 1 TsaB [Pyrinomonadaceae bacterium]